MECVNYLYVFGDDRSVSASSDYDLILYIHYDGASNNI